MMSENLRRVDLNLMVVFDALITARSVTQASIRLGMTQPAVSNALNRLRHLLKDRLFVRDGAGIAPPVRALELAGPAKEALRLLEATVVPAAFAPRTAVRTFQLALSHPAVLTLLP